MTTFRALVLHEEGGKVVPRIERLDEQRLPPGDVTVAVEYSTLNYKDGMILQGIGRLVRQLSACSRDRFRRHSRALGIAGVQARRSGDPDRLAGRRSAVGRLRREGAGQGSTIWCAGRRGSALGKRWRSAPPVSRRCSRSSHLSGTGFKPGAGDVLVTGAAGGVGSVAVALLSRLGHPVIASTGRPEQRAYLTELGAADLIDRVDAGGETDRGRSTASAGPGRSTRLAARPWRPS